MPQFDHTTYISQIFWLVVSFGIFYAFVEIYYLPRVRIILQKRRQYMDKCTEEAEKNKEELRIKSEESALVLERAYEESRRIVRSSIERQREQLRIEEEKLEEELVRSLGQTQKDIESQRERVYKSLGSSYSILVRDMVSWLGSSELGEEELESGIRELEKESFI